MIPQPEGHRLTHALSLNVLSDPVGKTFLSPCYRGESWGSESRYLSHLRAPAFRRKVAPGHPWRRTPHSQGRAGPQCALPTRQRGPETQSGKAATWMWILCFPRAVQRPPQELTLPNPVPNNRKAKSSLLARRLSPVKSRQGRLADVTFLW